MCFRIMYCIIILYLFIIISLIGTSLDVIFTVRNHGDGATIVDSWIDDIYWSDDEILGNL